MTASEFVKGALTDKAFLVEVCKNIPDEMLKEENQQQPEKKGLAPLMARYFYAASQEMGYEFDEAEFAGECDTQIGGLKRFAKIKYLGRFFKSLAKAGKGKEE